MAEARACLIVHTGDLFQGDRDDTFAEVAVPVPAEGPFAYRVPAHARAAAVPGARVRVEFAGRNLTGVVVATRRQPPAGIAPGKIRPLEDCLDPQPLLSPLLLTLTHWVATRTMTSWGEVVRSALPAGIDRISRRRVGLTAAGRTARSDAETVARLSAPARQLLEALHDAGDGSLTLGTLRREQDAAGTCAAAYELARVHLVEVDDEWSSGIGGRWDIVVAVPRHLKRDDAERRTRRTPAQRRALEALWDREGGVALETARELAGCSAAVISTMVGRGLLEARRVAAPADQRRAWSAADDGAGSFALMRSQQLALERIEEAGDGFRSLLLHGVTGSGKTEVYLRAARRTIERGRTALLLVPEIGLTPLLEHRARAVLGDAVGVLHSGLSQGERLANWWAARAGRVHAVIGPRSAVFAPLDDVGLIVVDEEQDGAYKQDESPRYHGRDVALQRARLEGATVVMGSATPAVETYFDAGEGLHEIVPMPDRVAERSLPRVTVVDMREEWKRTGRTLMSELLEQQIADCLERGDQALLLLNRRGFAASLLCRACGQRVPCPECSVSLTLHRAERALRCHYCDHRAPVPQACPVCGSEQLRDVGHGTQQLEQAVRRVFPEARTRRFDADETRRRGAHAEILSAFGRGELDLLVGTQMLAKGHDFPGVTLVGAIGADDALGLPDFRAAERTFQLLTQMAGRAGRGDHAGTVVLQAYQPDHYAIAAAVEHDYERFYRREIAFRRRMAYPPLERLIACVCHGRNAVVVKEEADILAGALRDAAPESVYVLGPASPPLGKLRGQHRVQVLLRGPERDALRTVLEETLRMLRSQRRAPRDLRIDVDPINLM